MSSSARPSSTAAWMYFFGECDQTWHAVVLNQQKKGALPLPALSSQLSVCLRTSESKVIMRSRVCVPVFSILCLPTRPNFGSSVGLSLSLAHSCSTPRGPTLFVYSGFFCPG